MLDIVYINEQGSTLLLGSRLTALMPDSHGAVGRYFDMPWRNFDKPIGAFDFLSASSLNIVTR
jgi:hypothetical protein